MTTTTITQTASDAIAHIETQIMLCLSAIESSRRAIRNMPLDMSAFDREAAIADQQASIARFEGRIAGLGFALDEIKAIR